MVEEIEIYKEALAGLSHEALIMEALNNGIINTGDPIPTDQELRSQLLKLRMYSRADGRADGLRERIALNSDIRSEQHETASAAGGRSKKRSKRSRKSKRPKKSKRSRKSKRSKRSRK